MISLIKASWCTNLSIISSWKITFNLHAGAAMKCRPMSYKFNGCLLKVLKTHITCCTHPKRLSIVLPSVLNAELEHRANNSCRKCEAAEIGGLNSRTKIH